MPYYAGLNPSSDRLAAIPVSKQTLVCPTCGDTMKHLRTLAKFGVRREKLMFVCPSCKEVETKELKSNRQHLA
jgi:hypothetical protein